jgi:2-iminobutanoate/2-iminopropanoate deaminase
MPESVADQTKEALKNLFAIVEAAGYKKEDIVKCMCLLENISDFPEFNGAYGEMFGDHKPARAAFGGNQIPLGAKVEIDCIAVK